jgi:outer membrane protein assembly factor BamB
MKTSTTARVAIFCFLILCLNLQLLQAQQNNWTHFRGSNLNGISMETQVPLHWNDSTNIAWKVDVAKKGWSSPIVYGDQIWLTTATEDGKQLGALCLDFNTGNKLFDLDLFQPDSVYPKHSINSYATPTPCIEEGFVYLDFGSYGIVCLKTSDASVVWKRNDLKCEHVQGPASSPILYKDLLILHYEGTDVQYLVALNKHTGETVWKTERPAAVYEPLLPIGKKAYITPLIVNVNGKDLLISNGSAACIAYDPETGKEVWRVVQGEDSTIAMPIAENGTVYFYTGFVTPKEGEKYTELLAVNPDGKGDITTTNVLWRFKSPILQLSTPIITGGLIYTIDTYNTLYCLDVQTGKVMYSKKLKSKYNASPVSDANNIYFTSVKGETLVLKKGNILQIIGENKLPGEVYATPAIVRNSILIRTDKRLYRIGTK